MGWIVCAPGPGMLKAMVSVPKLAFASKIAWRKLPEPESAVVVTVKVIAETGETARLVSMAAPARTQRSRRMLTPPTLAAALRSTGMAPSKSKSL